MRLLLVEDNFRLGALVRSGLGDNGFAVDWVKTIDEAESAIATGETEMIVLDLGLPDGDGMDLIRRLREDQNMLPILVMTARSDLDDRILGLDAGADDFLVKPFAIEELSARCRALLRRPDRGLAPELALGNVIVRPNERSVYVDSKFLDAGRKEVDLLETLLRKAERVVPRETLERSIYSIDEEVTPNALDAVVSRLRRHLKNSQATVDIRTARGVGYSIVLQEFSP